MNGKSVEYVGFWSRVLANLVDSSMLVVGGVMPSYYVSGYFGDGNTVQTGSFWGEFLIGWVLYAIIVVTFWVIKQATPGKIAISAKIVDATTGGHPGTGRLIVRYLAYSTLVFLPSLSISAVLFLLFGLGEHLPEIEQPPILTLLFLPLWIGILWVAFDKKKQGWHDKLANTVVVSEVS